MPRKRDKDIKITVEIPFIFRISFAKYAYGLQGKFYIYILPFSFYIGLYYGLGWSITPEILKWCFELRSHLKRLVIIFRIGISEFAILQWEIKRLERKLTPEKKEQIKQIFSDLLEKTKTEG